MRLPFRDELDELFRGDTPVWLKVAGCAGVTAFVGVVSILRSRRQGGLGVDLSVQAVVGLGLGLAALGAVVGLFLALKDVVQSRLDRGERVSPVFALLFGSGLQSRIVGISILAVVVVAAIVVLFD